MQITEPDTRQRVFGVPGVPLVDTRAVNVTLALPHAKGYTPGLHHSLGRQDSNLCSRFLDSGEATRAASFSSL